MREFGLIKLLNSSPFADIRLVQNVIFKVNIKCIRIFAWLSEWGVGLEFVAALDPISPSEAMVTSEVKFIYIFLFAVDLQLENSEITEHSKNSEI
jgi:hypothetical protein